MILFAIALLAFSVEGTLGFGSTVIMVTLGAQFVALDVLLPAFIPISMALSLALVRRPIAWSVLKRMAPLLAIGIAAGIAIGRFADPSALLVAFGLFVTILATWKLAGRAALWPRPLLILGGVVHGLFGTGGPLIVYAVRTEIPDKTIFRSTLAVVWLALNTALLASMHRLPSIHSAWIAAALLPGLVVGHWLHRRLDATRFERAVWLLLLVAGAVLALRHV
jgi:uncharacterized membrane protein YfcA